MSGQAAGPLGKHTIALGGELDLLTAPEVGDRLETLLDTGATTIVVDLQEVSFMDSVGLNVLVMTHRQLRERGGGLVVVRASTPVRRVLEITGLDELLAMDEPDLPD